MQRSRSSGRGPLIPGSGYEVEPFRLPDEGVSDVGSTQHHGTRENVVGGGGGGVGRARHGAPSEASSSSGARSPEAGSTMPHVYVVHHDGGRAPVTVFTPQGTEVIELPPRTTVGRRVPQGTSSAHPGDSSHPQRPSPSPLGVRNADLDRFHENCPPSPGGGGGSYQD